MEQTNGDGRRLVLGFDAGCMTCSELAKRIEKRTDGKLEVRSLRDPQMAHLRKQALGENAPWAPTLVEIKGGRVRAWTGLKMGVILSGYLGPIATWRTLQALGGLSARRAPRDLEAGTAPGAARAGMSRGQFVKGLGGAVVTLGVLSGTTGAPSAAAPAGAPAGFKSIKKTDLRGNALILRARETAQREDIVNVMGRGWAVRLREGKVASVAEDGEQAILVEEATRTSDQGNAGVKTGRIEVKASRHTLANGAVMLAVGYKLPDDRLVLYHEFDQAVPDGTGEFKTRAALHSVDGEDLVLEGLSLNGGPVALEGADRLSATRVRCGRCLTTYRYRTLACIRQKWGCLLVACGACIPACASFVSCIYCTAIVCPYAYLYTCCRERGNVCVRCRG